MMDIFRRIRVHIAFTSVMTIILGLILIAAPGMAVRTLFLILGWILVISGVLSLLTALLSQGKPVGQADLVLGLIQLASGLVLLARPHFLMSLCGFAMGFLMLLHGVHDIQGAKEGKALGYDAKLPMVIGIVTLVLGIILMVNPFSTVATLIRAAGFFLLADGISDLLLILVRGRS